MIFSVPGNICCVTIDFDKLCFVMFKTATTWKMTANAALTAAARPAIAISEKNFAAHGRLVIRAKNGSGSQTLDNHFCVWFL